MARDAAKHAAEENARYWAMTPDERRAWNRRITERAAERRRELQRYIRSFACKACGTTKRIEWHHPKGDGEFKNRLAGLCRGSKAKVDKALAECEPLCLKCHRREHALMRRRAGIFPKRIRPEHEARIYGS